MGWFEWTAFGCLLALSVVRDILMYLAINGKYKAAYAERKRAEARMRALVEGLDLWKYGAHDEAYEMWRKHAFEVTEGDKK